MIVALIIRLWQFKDSTLQIFLKQLQSKLQENVPSKIKKGKLEFIKIQENKENIIPIFGNEEHEIPRKSTIPKTINKRKNQCAHPKILIVDDKKANASALNIHINSLGFKTDCANNGLSAIDMVCKKQFNSNCNCTYQLIIMDCDQPKIDNYQACQILKTLMEQGKFEQNYIIAYTANVSSENMEKCNKFQFDKIYFKPFKKEELKQVLNKLIK